MGMMWYLFLIMCLFIYFYYSEIYIIKLAIFTFLNAQSTDINYINDVVKSLPLYF